ncbi:MULTISPECIES: NrfD/PsrC family molybdoenzyme membrane anchor subunit [unclassified Halorhodospira]|uniref:NrfD/PsrC family molybdoenzyme membrane anchor subunit n=1 Tax=unclassified Halorhodospira TaxID=2626748 RepID=UPI001EE976FD|nr:MULTISPECIES: NrfD/PsrC family molybdoenzyme membrane anchor subunit [unclassified Halorhodospira]MCG5540363.1 polysulfide reductase NrfD [Halorhodospira sp. M39old]MCG5545784.1 polysulfide reductase NrfD [Halorhodospira sp. M38]
MSTAAEQTGRAAARTSHLIPYITLAIGIVGLAIAFALALPVLTEGGQAMAMGSDMIWGLPVAGYAFLALTSMGVSLVAATALLSERTEWHRATPRLFALALGLSVGAILVLNLELGNALRSLWAIPTAMQLRSPLVWMGLAWTAYMVLVIAVVARLHTVGSDDQLTRRLAVGIIIAGGAAIFTQGLAYGMFVFRPVWYGMGTPLYFFAGAVASGLAVSLIAAQSVRRFQDRGNSPEWRSIQTYLPAAFGVALGVYATVLMARIVGGLWSPTAGVQVVYLEILRSPLFWTETVLGLVIPLVLMARAAWRVQPWAQVTAAALALIGLFIARYELTIGGQMVPLFKGTWIPGFIEYSPNTVEWGIVLVGVFTALIFYALGDRLLRAAGPNRRQGA